MITVHHLNSSRSQRIIWLLEELGLPYEVIRYERDKKTFLAPPDLKKVHPLGKSPVITDNDLVLAESGAITEYLVNKYGDGKLKPKNESDLIKYTYWLHYAEGSLMPLLVMKLIFSKVETSAPLIVRPVAKAISENVNKLFLGPNIKTNFDFLESELGKSKWFAGEEFSAADIQMSYPIEASDTRVPLKQYPRLQAYLSAIRSRDAYKKAINQI